MKQVLVDEELLQQALVAIEQGAWDTLRGRNAAEALRAVLDPPEGELCGCDKTTGNCTKNGCCKSTSQQPVAWRVKNATPPGGYTIFQQYPQAIADQGLVPVEPLYTQPSVDLFGYVTIRRLSQRFENHSDQYTFYPAEHSPYLDNVDECITVYTKSQRSQEQIFKDVLEQPPLEDEFEDEAHECPVCCEIDPSTSCGSPTCGLIAPQAQQWEARAEELLSAFDDNRLPEVSGSLGGKMPQQVNDWRWVCNECGSPEYTSSVSEDDIQQLGCGNCGGCEWHKETTKDRS